ncbi:MAG: cellulase family glycosylhydrolase [Deltaproteobacteria bacterium]|nr:cellulase family glycosylhydrolase [Deltaproteobacteria bacterium]
MYTDLQLNGYELNTDSIADLNTDSNTNTDQGSDTIENSDSNSESDSDSIVNRYLHIDGVLLKNRANKTVNLRGINLGGWLVTENWMCGIKDSTDTSGRFALETLESRFGTEQANKLIETWRENFITTSDLDNIKDLGFNVIRVPFGFRNLQDGYGNWIRKQNNEIDFGWMDWIVNEAAKRDLYVLFDYHIWHGQQNNYDYITCGPDEPQRQEERDASIELLTEVINHYKGDGTVAALELINEACGGTWGAIFLYDALRQADPDRLFLIWGDPREDGRNWKNVFYGPHEYSLTGPAVNDDILTINNNVEKIKEFQTDFNVPYFTGEFHVFTNNGNPSMTYLLEQYAINNIGWAKWMYKGVDNGAWAIVNINNNTVDVDVENDDYDIILKKWQSLKTAGTYQSTELKDILATAAALK